MRLTALTLAIALSAPPVARAEDTPHYHLSDGHAVTARDRFQECEACPEMIVMPLGSFMMGAIPGESRNPFDIYGEDAQLRKRGPDEPNIIPSEHPRHSVEMDITFAIGRNVVTHAEWMACVAENGCSHTPDHWTLSRAGYIALGPNHPVVNVSYLDVKEYVTWLNEKVGAEIYRLPTEAEWEYAARAGTETRFAQGDELTSEQANFLGSATARLRGTPMPELIDRQTLVQVDELDAANGWGVRHMSGNVYEWTLSCWSPQHLGLETDSAYLAHARAQQSCRRVAKGGSYTNAMDQLRLATRLRPSESRRRDFVGFRLVRVLTPAAPS